MAADLRETLLGSNEDDPLLVFVEGLHLGLHEHLQAHVGAVPNFECRRQGERERERERDRERARGRGRQREPQETERSTNTDSLALCLSGCLSVCTYLLRSPKP